MDRSRYDGHIPAEWDRSDPAGQMIDVTTGLPIRDVEHYGGWTPLADGVAARDDDPAFAPHLRRADPAPLQANAVPRIKGSSGQETPIDDTLLLLS